MANKTLYAYDESGKYVRSYSSPAVAKSLLNVEDISHIYKVISGKRAFAFGYRWSKKRCVNIINNKKKDFEYAIFNDTTNKLVFKADNYIAIAKRFNVNTIQLRKGIASSGNNLFRQKFRIEKVSKHKL